MVGLGVLLSIGVTEIPNGQANSSPTGALQARRTQLLEQLAALQPAKNSAASSLTQAEQAFAAIQSKLLAEQQRLAQLNARLLALSGQIADNEATIVKAKQQLAVITRQSYQSTTTDSWVAAVLSASTFQQAMDRLTGTSHMAEQVKDLQSRVRAKEQAILAARAEVQKDATDSTALEDQLALDSNALLAMVQNRNAAFQAASAPARAIAAQIAEIDQQIAAGNRPASPSGSSGSCGNHFAYGQCTWYVASRRCIPWLGNARDWYYQAERYGYPVGHAPQVGAVIVWPGVGPGHVGYVESVGPSAGVPAGSFKISEMNWNGGWNRVSYRVISSSSGGIQGFIYAK